ncbi:MAG TPA: hypothetical protein VHB77_06005 [Planctomycetaceae bacterium]|nr:hypothetical protein [Planctomycetaceae bacterium]
MSRQVRKTETTDPAGNTVRTRTVHKERPRKTVDKVVQRTDGPTTHEKTRTKVVSRKARKS